MSTKYLSNLANPNKDIDLRVFNLQVDGSLSYHGAGDLSLNDLSCNNLSVAVSADIQDLVVNAETNTDNLKVVDQFTRTKGTVTQTGTITSTVVLNAPAGVITTVSTPGIAANDWNFFEVQCDAVAVGDMVFVNVVNHPPASTGAPVASVKNIANGSFEIMVINAVGAALNTPVQIAFQVVKAI